MQHIFGNTKAGHCGLSAQGNAVQSTDDYPAQSLALWSPLADPYPASAESACLLQPLLLGPATCGQQSIHVTSSKKRTGLHLWPLLCKLQVGRAPNLCHTESLMADVH